MQQPGGSPYGAAPPAEISPFSAAAGGGARSHLLTIDPLQPPPPEAASPISSRPPTGGGPVNMAAGAAAAKFDELVPGVNFTDDEAALAGEEAERGGGSGGNRWPRQETLALLKIRSEMDAAFRDATLKGLLWDEVSRKLAELGYKRSAKKCKEKFENVHKYYKRTKEGRAGRQDGKSYRFFTQLEALHSAGAAGAVGTSPFASTSAAPPVTAVAPPPILAPASPTPISFSAAMMAGSGGRIQPSPLSAAPPPLPFATTPVAGIPTGGISFSSNSSSSASLSDSDDEATDEGAGRKRKRGGGGGSSSGRKMMTFFEGLMKQVMERQEAMQQRFLETIEKREQDRMIREEAWRRQEMARLSREQELFAQERAMAASRDATLLSYIQKITGSQSVQLPTIPVGAISVVTTTTTPSPPPPPPQQKQPMTVQPLQQQPPPPRQQEIQLHHQSTEIVLRQQPPSGTELVEVPEGQQTDAAIIGFEPMSASSSRWPKAEVHALIKLRSGLESRYQEAGAKGPLWEEISAGMQRLGYSRSSKRCKEKWENINKYFKKVKESNKKRPEDAKTCPYFHQLDALYRSKQVNLAATGARAQQQQQQQLGQEQTNQDLHPQERTEAPLIIAAAAASAATQTPPPQAQQAPAEAAEKNGSNNNGGGGGLIQVQTSNGGIPPNSSYFEEGMKKPEDIVKDLMDDYDKMEDGDSDDMDQIDEDQDEEDDDVDRKMQYKIQFHFFPIKMGSLRSQSLEMAMPLPHILCSDKLASPAPAAAPLSQDELKRVAAHRAVEQVRSGMVLGLGTGSTAAHALDRIGELLRRGALRDVVGVPTSEWAAARAIAAGIPLTNLNVHPVLDLSIDGADEVDPYLNLVKGRGGSLLREKMVEGASRLFVVIVDESKLVPRLGGSRLAVPVEVIPFGYALTLRRLRELFVKESGFQLKLRTATENAKAGTFGEDEIEPEPFVTDNGNYIVDLYFEDGIRGELNLVSDEILRITGVVEHGMFLGLATSVIIASKDGVRVINKEELR